MAAIKTIKYVCPHCGKKAKSLFGMPQRKLVYYGCSHRRCHRCAGEYTDHRIKEIGLYDIETTYPRWDEMYMGWIVYYALVVIGYGFIAYHSKSVLGSGLLYLAAVLLGSFVLQILANLMTLNWRKSRWQEEYNHSLARLGRQQATSMKTDGKPGMSLGLPQRYTTILLAVAMIALVATGLVTHVGNSYDQRMRNVLEYGPSSDYGKGNALVAYDEHSARYTDRYIPAELRTDDPAQVRAVVYITRGETPSLGGRIPTYRTVGFIIRDAVSGEIVSTFDSVLGGEDGSYPDEHTVASLVAEKWSLISKEI